MRDARKVLPILMSVVLVVGLCPGLGFVARLAVPDTAYADGATQVMYRLYNPNSGEHFYTASEVERDAVAGAGWDYEGEGWTAPVSSSTPVYRLYSGTDHHYTTSAVERDHLVSVGWSDEGTGWYSDDAKGVPLYRQFNPNVDPSAPTNNSGSHNYTTSLDEHNMLVSIGWNDEGTGWYGVDTSASQMPTAPEGIVYQDNVVEVPAADYSGLQGGSVTISGISAPKIVPYETIILLEPTQDNPTGSALKVASVDWQGDSAVVSANEAGFSDVVKTMKVSGSTSEVYSLSPNVDVVEPEQIVAQGVDSKGTLKLDSYGFEPFDGMTVKLSPSIEYSFDFSWGKVNECKLVANINADVDYEWASSLSKSVKLFSSVFSTPVPGLVISADFYLVCHANGEVKIEADLFAGAGIEFDGSKVNPVSTSGLSYSGLFEAEVGAGVNPELRLRYFGLGIANVSSELGLNVEGTLAQYDASLTCADLSAWVYADVEIGKSDTVLGWAMDLLDIDTTYHPLNKGNSKIYAIHVENGKIVDRCTMSNKPVGGDGGKGDIPELEDNGYGETPKLENRSEWTYYCNKLVEPFNVPAGKTVAIGGTGHSAIAFGYGCDPGTVFRLKKVSWDGVVESDSLSAFVSFGQPWYDDCIWIVEVYCGRVVIDDITAWSPPPVSFGTCEPIKYPLRLSDSKVVMRVGETYQLSSENDFKELVGESVEPVWSGGRDSLGSWIVDVDRNGKLTANKRGTTTVTAEISGLYKRTCTVTVI